MEKLDLQKVKAEVIRKLHNQALIVEAMNIVKNAIQEFVGKKITRREIKKINDKIRMNNIYVYPDFNGCVYYIRFYCTTDDGTEIGGTEESVYMGSEWNNPNKIFTEDLFKDLCEMVRGNEELYEKMDEVNLNIDLLVASYNSFIDVFDGFKSMMRETFMDVFPEIFKSEFK